MAKKRASGFTKRRLMNLLEREAGKYRRGAIDSVGLNAHQNNLSLDDFERLKHDPDFAKRVIDAVLIDFINTVGIAQGLKEEYSVKYLSEDEWKETTGTIEDIFKFYGDLWGGIEGVRLWLKTPHDQLNHRTPQSIIDEGRSEVILVLLKDMLTGQPT